MIGVDRLCGAFDEELWQEELAWESGILWH